jgi:CubicO group peptidase (beta-lactamase class C family)
MNGRVGVLSGRHLIRVAAVLCGVLLLSRGSSAQALLNALFERYADALRQETHIPGISAAIVRSGQVDWDRGFGHQDVERSIAASPETPYPVGALMQNFTAILLGTCAERGALDIDASIRTWAPSFADNASIRQVLAHASEPSREFRYDLNRYAALTAVAQACSDKAFRASTADVVLEKLGMASSVPGADLVDPDHPARELFDERRLERYDDVVRRMALPYRVDRSSGRATRADVSPQGLNASTGLISTVRDLARFDGALDDESLLRNSSLEIAWSQARFGSATLPTGLGWFVQYYNGEKLVWQFSQASDVYSGIVLKVPGRRLTLILLANSNGLSSGLNLEQGDITASPFVKIFLRLFVD